MTHAGTPPRLHGATLSEARAVDGAPPRLGRATRVAVPMLLLATWLAATAASVLAVGRDPARPEIVDFHAFYLAGQQAWAGHFADSYAVHTMQALQRSLGGGREVFMPFVYPPAFGLVLAPLAMLPVGAAFALFSAATLAFYLAVLRRIAGPWFWHALLVVSPVLVIDIRLGQNGLLTGGLAALAADMLARRRDMRAGVLAGLLAFKPQIATTLPLLFGLSRRWRGLGVAAATAFAVTGSAVLVLGRDTVPGFLASTAVVADFMAAGSFPLHRMTSLYAFALSLRAPARAALAIHALVAMPVVVAATGLALRFERPSRCRRDRRTAGGVMLMATAFVSPYFFDYDLTVFGAGLAFTLPALACRLSWRALVALMTAVGVVGAASLWCNLLVSLGAMPRLALGGPMLLACFGIVLATLREGPAVTAGSERQPDGRRGEREASGSMARLEGREAHRGAPAAEQAAAAATRVERDPAAPLVLADDEPGTIDRRQAMIERTHGLAHKRAFRAGR